MNPADMNYKMNELFSTVRRNRRQALDTAAQQYDKIPGPIRSMIPTSDTSIKTFSRGAEMARKSKIVPSRVADGLYGLAGASSYKKARKDGRLIGGKKSKKQNPYTKKEKKKINGVTKVIYTKKNSKKLYVKSKGRMMNLKKYKKISKKR